MDNSRGVREKTYQLYIPVDKTDLWLKLRDKFDKKLASMVRELVEEKADEWLSDSESDSEDVQQIDKQLVFA